MKGTHSGTRERLLDAASELFAAGSIDGTSIRSVTRAAGLGAASVHYHFGDKDALLAGVLDRLGGGVLADIARRAQAALDGPRPVQTLDLVDAIALPYFELLDADRRRGREWLHVVTQLVLSEDPRLLPPTAAATEALQALLARAFPAAAPDLRQRSWALTVNVLMSTLARDEDVVLTGGFDRDALRRYLAGGLDAVLG